ncbi:GNAT family N-acetyltransferase [Nucisporomicrobium flavum]|uniref:GNAT family N-acetyltransferase n=1 Tax=Nucisporomicrobium flavum TaxID=2785915 RepID=UPI0018F40FCF|nr:GNAT family N-acetyltransferase [Nucisporomicrobium flavum]
MSSIAAVLSNAFLDGDLAPWLVAELGDRRRIYPHYFAMFAEHALEHGRVEITEDRLAVAVWYPYHPDDPPPVRDYDTRLGKITAPYTARFVALDDAMRRHHPHDEPHHYLGWIAVNPNRQHRGYGTQLLRHHARHLDAAGISAYLEATSPTGRDWYARHGYQPREPYPVARGGPLLYPMWRPPADTSTTPHSPTT